MSCIYSFSKCVFLQSEIIFPSAAPELQFSASSYDVYENESSVSVCVQQNIASYLDIPFTVNSAESSPLEAIGE